MNISKRKQGILAIICTIAMIVTSITVYNPREVKADPSATVDGKQYSATVKDSGEWTGFACQGIFDSARIHFAWGIAVDAATITASLNGNQLKVAGQNANGMYIPLTEVTNLEVGSYDIVVTATTVATKTAEAKEVSATATLKIEKVEGTTELQKPSAPTDLVANINNLKTDYTIAFANVATATSYKFYLDGTYKKDITNGGIVTIEELGLEAGKTYKFGVSAVNAAGESDITTIDVKVPGKEEETTTPTFEEGKELIPSDKVNAEITLEKHTVGQTEYIQEHKADSIHIESGKWYVGQFTITSSVRKYFEIRVQDAAAGHASIPANTEFKKVLVEAGQTVNVRVRFKADRTTDSAIFDICMGYIKEESEAGKVQITNNSLRGYTNEPEATKYTVSIDGTEEQYEEGATITVPAEGQGYYDVTKKVAYAPRTELTVNENMTLKSIKLNVTMTPGASIRLAAPTGLRFQTTVKSENGIAADEILNSKTVTTGTLITTLASYEHNGNTLTRDSKYTFLDIANDGWFNDGTKTETGKFCGSIIKIKKENYGRKFIAVGYATINYSNGDSKTVYANVTANNAKSIAYVAEQVKGSEKFSGYSAEQKDIINKYINREEIPE